MRPSAAYYWMKRILREAGLPEIRFHDLSTLLPPTPSPAAWTPRPCPHPGPHQRQLHPGHLHPCDAGYAAGGQPHRGRLSGKSPGERPETVAERQAGRRCPPWVSGGKRARAPSASGKTAAGRARMVIGYDEKSLPRTKNVLAKTKRECQEKLKLAPGDGDRSQDGEGPAGDALRGVAGLLVSELRQAPDPPHHPGQLRGKDLSAHHSGAGKIPLNSWHRKTSSSSMPG